MLQFRSLGDQALQVIFDSQIQESSIHKIRCFTRLVKNQNHLYIKECIPTYTALSIYYDVLKISYDELVEELKQLQLKIQEESVVSGNVVEIPVLYGGEFGPDLKDIAEWHQLCIDEVIRIHSSSYYLIYMLGFSPGFPYLGGLSEKIATPRLSNPRPKVAGGSVGIAGNQTGIYPSESPGGWRIIGRTPLRLYDADDEPPNLLHAGDYLRFVPIDKKEFKVIVEMPSNQQTKKIKKYAYKSI